MVNVAFTDYVSREARDCCRHRRRLRGLEEEEEEERLEVAEVATTSGLEAAEVATTSGTPKRRWETRRRLAGRWRKAATEAASVRGRVIPCDRR